MLKIGKGLHKKKKSKKNKQKEKELFTEEELEQYRREHSQKGANSEESEGKKVNSEEFEKFKALTAGVDDALRKSQGDLDRIKKESFFQRRPTPSELKEREEREKQESNQGNPGNFEGEKEEEFKEKEESESEYEFDEKDDIFDTTYVEAIESGKVKLVYVPDEEESIESGEPDPFDTSSAELILKRVREEEERKRRQVSLGQAVQVLTGRAERDKSILKETVCNPVSEVDHPETENKVRSRPRKIQEVALIGSFDEENFLRGGKPSQEALPRSLLDEDLNVEFALPEGDVLLNEVLQVKRSSSRPEVPLQDQSDSKGETDSHDLRNVLSEFDEINERVASLEVRKAEEVEDQFDEFTALAVSSVANQKLEEELKKFEDLENDPFDTSNANLVLKEPVDPFGKIDFKGPFPQIAELSSSNPKWSAAFKSEEESLEDEEIDPFDTSIADRIVPGKCELKLLESEFLSDIVDSAHKSDVYKEARILSRDNSENKEDAETSKRNRQSYRSSVSIQITDPSGFVQSQRGSESSESREEDLVSLSFKHRDLLGGSTTDLTKLTNEPLPPEIESPLEDFSRYSDPFDTSIVDQVTIPGKAELKFIEKELLEDLPAVGEKDSLTDGDFDPRREEVFGQKVSFDLPSPVASDGLPSNRELGIRPLTPYSSYARDSESETCGDSDDPFDTSQLNSLPGKEELKLLERELDGVRIAEEVFESVHKKLGIAEDVSSGFQGLKHSLSDQNFNPREEGSGGHQQQSSAASRRFSDVTDLSRHPPKSLNFRPAEFPALLVVEEEQFEKALTPEVDEDISSYVDPFDTSAAENIAPGRAELKVLESELIPSDSTNQEGGIKRSCTDPDFNPRNEVARQQGASEADILSLPENSEIDVRPLTPAEFETSKDDSYDPFDTSVAENLLPGKAEIKALESELIGQ